MDPEQTAPLKHFSRREKQTTFVAIGALRVKVVNVLLAIKQSCVLDAQKNIEH